MKGTSERELREAFAAHHGESVEGAEHVTPETLWSLAAGELAADEAAEVVDHLSRCPACAEDYRLTRELAAESGGGEVFDVEEAGDLAVFSSDRGRDRRPSHRSRGRWAPALAAAAALTLATGVWLQLPSDPEAPPVYRQPPGETPEIRPLVEDGAVMDRTAVHLRWTPIDGARYDLLVSTQELEMVLEARFLDEASFEVDEQILQDLPAGATLIWQVEAVLPGGRRVSSPAFELRLDGSESPTPEALRAPGEQSPGG